MYPQGIKISELRKLLADAEKRYGDVQVYLPGYDYPAGVGGVHFVEKGDSYTPTGVLEIVAKPI